MRMRTRKLVGTVLMILLVLVYFAIAVEITTSWLATAHYAVQLLGYLVAGFLWIIPAGAIIKWMSKPDPVPCE
jgi:Protein of unknown function (DUF2842)